MMFVRRLLGILVVAAALLGAVGADATPFGQRRALLKAAPVLGPTSLGFTVNGTPVGTLRDLGAALTAAPDATVVQLGPYNARRDGTFSTCPIVTPFTGSFDGGGYAIDRVKIVSADFTISGKFAVFCQVGTAAKKTITAITNANPGQVTATGHGYTTGDQLWLTGIQGTTELNGQYVTITVLDADSFTIGVDTTAYGAYASGGQSQRIVGSISDLLVTNPTVRLTGTSTDATIIGQQAAGLVAFNAGVLTDVGCTGAMVTADSIGSQNGGCVANNQGHITNIACTNNSVIIGLRAANTYQALCVAYNQAGVIDGTNTVTGGTMFAPSGDDPLPQPQCGVPPCPATGVWGGPAVGANGPNTSTGTTGVRVSGFTIGSDVTIIGSTVNAATNIMGAVVGNTLDAILEQSGSNASIAQCANWCGGVFGNGQGTASHIRYVWWNGVSINAASNKVGQIGGQLAGTLEYFWAGNGSVTGLKFGLVGDVGAVGAMTNASAVVRYGFNWGPATSTGNGAGGIAGTTGGGTVNQVYTLGVVSGSAAVGCALGFDNDDAKVTNTYFGTDTCGSSRGAGNVASPAGITGQTLAQLKAALPAGFDSAIWDRDAGGVIASGLPYLKNMPVPPAYVAAPAWEYHVLTGSGNFTVTAQCASGRNTIDAIGEGGNGSAGLTTAGGRGGGGGAWARISNLAMTQGASIAYTAGTGGSGTDTMFKDSSTLLAKPGGNAAAGASGTGGSSGSSVGTSKFGGASGGANSSSCAGGGGGGAAGPIGIGTAGQASGGSAGTACGGGGGGAASGGGTTGGGSAATAGTITAGGNGATANDGTTAGGAGSSAPGTPGGAGSLGSGGGGGFASGTTCSVGGAGSYTLAYSAWPSALGPGSGAGGAGGATATTSACAGAAGGGYGGGGSGGGRGVGTGGAAGSGAPGAILMVCKPRRRRPPQRPGWRPVRRQRLTRRAA